MPRLTRTPYGAAIENDDGTVSFLPPDMVPQEGGGLPGPATPSVQDPGPAPRGFAMQQPDGSSLFLPPEFANAAGGNQLAPPLDPDAQRVEQSISPVPDLAHEQIGRTAPTSLIANPDAPLPPPGPAEIDMDPSMPGDTPGVDPTTSTLAGWAPPPSGIADPFATGTDANGINPDDIENESDAPGDAAATDDPFAVAPEAPAPAAPNAGPPILDPFQQKAMAAETAAAAAALASQDQAAILAARNAEADKIEAQRAEARALALQHRQELFQQYSENAEKQADFDMRKPDSSLRTRIVNSIAIALGAIGAALERKGGANPVLAILNAQVEEEARERAAMYGKLRDDTAGAHTKIGLFDEQSTSEEAFYQGQLAAAHAQAAREIEHSAKLAEGPEAKARAALYVADQLAKAKEAADKAAQQQFDNRASAAKIVIDNKNATTASRNAEVNDYSARTARQNVYIDDANTDARLTFDSGKSDIEQDHWQKEFDQKKLERAEKARQDAVAEGKTDAAADRIARDVKENYDARRGPRIPTATTITDANGIQSLEVRDEPLRNQPEPKFDAFGRPVLGPDGKQVVEASEWLAPDVERGRILGRKHAAVRNYTRLLDDLITIVDAEGWSSDSLKSAEWLQAKQAFNEAVVQYKSDEIAKLGVIAGADLPIIQGAIGTDDPTQIRDSMAGVKQARESAVKALNIAFQDEGLYTGEPIVLPNVHKLPGGTLGPAAQLAKGITAQETPGATPGGLKEFAAGASLRGGNLTQGQAIRVSDLVKDAKSGDAKAAADAREKLAALAKRDDVGPGIVDFLAVENVVMDDIDKALGEQILKIRRDGGVPAARKRMEHNLGIGGIVRKAYPGKAVGRQPKEE